ncbi:MAG: hypothetical protein RIC16_09525 [Rhodospirillales bacterium]
MRTQLIGLFAAALITPTFLADNALSQDYSITNNCREVYDQDPELYDLWYGNVLQNWGDDKISPLTRSNYQAKVDKLYAYCDASHGGNQLMHGYLQCTCGGMSALSTLLDRADDQQFGSGGSGSVSIENEGSPETSGSVADTTADLEDWLNVGDDDSGASQESNLAIDVPLAEGSMEQVSARIDDWVTDGKGLGEYEGDGILSADDLRGVEQHSDKCLINIGFETKYWANACYEERKVKNPAECLELVKSADTSSDWLYAANLCREAVRMDYIRVGDVNRDPNFEISALDRVLGMNHTVAVDNLTKQGRFYLAACWAENWRGWRWDQVDNTYLCYPATENWQDAVKKYSRQRGVLREWYD